MPDRTSVHSSSVALDLIGGQHVGVAQVRAPEIVQGKDSIDLTHLGVEYLTSVVAATRQSQLEEVRRQVGVHPLTISSGVRAPRPFFEAL
jgi:hypothetical protein